MRVMLVCSSFNGLSQRVWLDLQAAGHLVGMHIGGGSPQLPAAVAAFNPDLVICPFLRERIPASVWRRWRTIVIHPGPVGDRGPSSLDWAISESARTWGATALQAVEELDAGPVWAHRTFPVPAGPPSKSGLYNGPVADAAVSLVREVVAAAGVASFVPHRPHAVAAITPAAGRARHAMRQGDRAFGWAEPTDHIVRRIRAADGSPGVRTVLRGQPVSVFDAHPGPDLTVAAPGEVIGQRRDAVLVRTGDGTVWIGQIRCPETDLQDRRAGIKLPAALALPGGVADLPVLRRGQVEPDIRSGFREIGYRRHGPVGVLSFDAYNGALSTRTCRRLARAVRKAVARDTRVLVIRGGQTFANGIHLNVIEASEDPAMEAWRNITAIDEVCREIIACTRQLVVCAVTGNAGAGGVMLALGAHRVLARDTVVLNPHYRTMGLYGSEYWTYVLPRRVGHHRAAQLTEQCLPISAGQAIGIGLADQLLPAALEEADRAVAAYAAALADSDDYSQQLAAERVRRADDERRLPLEAHRIRELAEMSHDIFGDRHGFAAARRHFVTKSGRNPAAGVPSLRRGA